MRVAPFHPALRAAGRMPSSDAATTQGASAAAMMSTLYGAVAIVANTPQTRPPRHDMSNPTVALQIAV